MIFILRAPFPFDCILYVGKDYFKSYLFFSNKPRFEHFTGLVVTADLSSVTMTDKKTI